MIYDSVPMAQLYHTFPQDVVPSEECVIHALEVGGKKFWNKQCLNNLCWVKKTDGRCEPWGLLNGMQVTPDQPCEPAVN